MLFDSVYLAGIGSYLPARRTVADAIAADEYDLEDAETTRYTSICVSDELGPAEMAVRAARTALTRAGVAAEDVAALLHAHMTYPGLDFWPIANYVHHELFADRARHAPAFEVGQMSNGGLAALQLAVGFLLADATRPAVLVTTGDRFADPLFDRWRGDLGIVMGDGGSAAVLSTTPGFARVRGVHGTTDSRLEGLHRGDETFTRSPGRAVDLRGRRAAFRAHHDNDEVTGWIRGGLVEMVTGALAETGLARDDVAAWVLPAVGLQGTRSAYLEPLGVPIERTTWEFGRTTGHIGAADQFLGLEQLLRRGALRPGDVVGLVGIGAGFTWTLATVEILAVPDWGQE